MYFLLRALATENFLLFLFEMETIIDILTIPPLFFSIWMERTWLGLRFFRFLIWINFPDILVYVRALSNSSSIRLAQVIFKHIFLVILHFVICSWFPTLLASYHGLQESCFSLKTLAILGVNFLLKTDKKRELSLILMPSGS